MSQCDKRLMLQQRTELQSLEFRASIILLDNQDTIAIRAQKKIIVSYWHPCGHRQTVAWQVDVKWGKFYDITITL